MVEHGIGLAVAVLLAATPPDQSVVAGAEREPARNGISSAPQAASPQAASGFTWCASAPLLAELDHWLDGTGIFSVYGWSYQYYNAHSAALRIDGQFVYATNAVPGASPFTSVKFDVNDVLKTGKIVHLIDGIAEVTTWLKGAEDGGCCALQVLTQVRNLDWVPHRFEWRWFHDTAYKRYLTCPRPTDPDVDGGEVCLPGEILGSTCRKVEFDALAAGAVGCGKSLSFYSADTGLLGPVYVFDDLVNPPVNLEILSWESAALDPVNSWSGFVSGEPIAGCTGDNSILAIWQLPADGRKLNPRETTTLTWRVGNGCLAPCCRLGADAGPDRSSCATLDTELGGTPVARDGTGPFVYRWTPDDGSLSDPAAEHPRARPKVNQTYTVQVVDAVGCAAFSSVNVALTPDLVPRSVGNTLLGVKRTATLDSDFEWQAVAGAVTYTVRGDGDKHFVALVDDVTGLFGARVTIPADPTMLRFRRVVGVSCSGQVGP